MHALSSGQMMKNRNTADASGLRAMPLSADARFISWPAFITVIFEYREWLVKYSRLSISCLDVISRHAQS